MYNGSPHRYGPSSTVQCSQAEDAHEAVPAYDEHEVGVSMSDTLPHFPVYGAPRGEANTATVERALGEMQAASDQFRIAIDTIPGLVWTALPDGSVDFLNQRWLEYTGLTLEQASGWGWQKAISPEDLSRLVEYWRSVLASGKPGEIEARLRRHDGVDRWFLFRGVPQYDEQGNLVKWYGQTMDIEDRRRAEEEVKKQTAHLDELFELAPHAVVLVDADISVIRVNREFTRMFGYTPAEAINRPLLDLVAPEERLSEYRNNARMLSSGQKVESETIRRRKDGVRIAVSMTASPVLTAGPIEGYIIYRDITGRKRDEALLAGEKRLLEMIAKGDSLPRILEALCRLVEETAAGSLCSILLVDPNGRQLRAGAAPSLPLEYTQALDGRVIELGIGPCGDALQSKQPVIASDFRTDERWSEEYRALALAYGLRACWSTPILSLEGGALGTFALYYREPRSPTPEEYNVIEQFRDIASIAIERTQAEDALRRNEALLAEAQRLTRTGSFSWRVTTDEITWSEETYRIYELDHWVRPTMGMVRQRVHPTDLPLFDRAVRRATAEGRDFFFEHRLLFPGGAVKHLQVVAHVSGATAAAPLEYVGTVMDVTDRKRSEDALDRARTELAHVSRVTTLGQMTASIAHEINQPLTGIVINGNACLRWLAGESPNLHEAREATRRIVRDGQRAGDVITRLRSLFRREGSPNERLGVNEVVHEVIALTRGEVHNGGATVRTRMADDLPLVSGDRVQLQQLLLNLILNAVEAMSEVHDRPREINISTQRGEGNEVLVAVRDSGVGLDPQGKEKLFDAFYTSKSVGMGMGLAISRSIVEHHGGRLWAASNDGPGATFLFTIPWNAAGEDPGPMCP
jgi:PAS domain S-box-containing protein